jgi:hypothetical protein
MIDGGFSEKLWFSAAFMNIGTAPAILSAQEALDYLYSSVPGDLTMSNLASWVVRADLKARANELSYVVFKKDVSRTVRT